MSHSLTTRKEQRAPAPQFDYGDLPSASIDLLEQIAREIQLKQLSVRKTTVGGILAIGEFLSRVHDALAGTGRDGMFRPWCKARCGFSEKTARRAMQAFNTFGKKRDTVSLFFEPTAMYALCAESCPEAATQTALTIAKKGTIVTAKVAHEIIAKHTEVQEPEELLAAPVNIPLVDVEKCHKDAAVSVVDAAVDEPVAALANNRADADVQEQPQSTFANETRSHMAFCRVNDAINAAINVCHPEEIIGILKFWLKQLSPPAADQCDARTYFHDDDDLAAGADDEADGPADDGVAGQHFARDDAQDDQHDPGAARHEDDHVADQDGHRDEEDTAAHAAHIVGVPVEYVHCASRVLQSGNDEVIAAVERGSMTLHKAEQALDVRKASLRGHSYAVRKVNGQWHIQRDGATGWTAAERETAVMIEDQLAGREIRA